MPQAGDSVSKQSISKTYADTPELEILFLPSDFTPEQRKAHQLEALGLQEYKLREGAAFDALRSIRNIVKSIDTIGQQKKKNDYGQTRHTRSTAKIHATAAQRDMLINHYNKNRTAMISLGLDPQDPTFPPLTVTDTHRASTLATRRIGASRQMDGIIWTMTGVSGGTRAVGFGEAGPSTSPSGPTLPDQYPAIGTQGSRPMKSM